MLESCTHIGLPHYLILGAILLTLGIIGVLTRRNAIGILMSLELIFNAINVTAVAFNHFLYPAMPTGQVWAIFVITIAAAEAAVGLAIILAVYRSYRTINVDQINLLRW